MKHSQREAGEHFRLHSSSVRGIVRSVVSMSKFETPIKVARLFANSKNRDALSGQLDFLVMFFTLPLLILIHHELFFAVLPLRIHCEHEYVLLKPH